MKTLTPKPTEIKRDWYLIDANEQTLGRLSTKVAHLLKGKNKTYYVPHLDCGDFVIIVNADKIVLSGSKELQKEYQAYSGYPGGLKKIPFKRMLSSRPENIIFKAVKGMLPKNSLGRQMIKKLKIYVEETHPHSAQKPVVLSV